MLLFRYQIKGAHIARDAWQLAPPLKRGPCALQQSRAVAIPGASPPRGGASFPGSSGAPASSAPQRLPAPAFGSSPNLQALALDAAAEPSMESRTFQEITVVSADQPKLLSRLSEVMVRFSGVAPPCCSDGAVSLRLLAYVGKQWYEAAAARRIARDRCTVTRIARSCPLVRRVCRTAPACTGAPQHAPAFWRSARCAALTLQQQPQACLHPSNQKDPQQHRRAQGDLGLNICEAHAFNTSDRFSLDIFVVDGWAGDGGTSKESLEQALSTRFAEVAPAAANEGGGGGGADAVADEERRIPNIVRPLSAAFLPLDRTWPTLGPLMCVLHSPTHEAAARRLCSRACSRTSELRAVQAERAPAANAPARVQASSSSRDPLASGMEDWEVDINQLDIESKLAQGSFGTLYKGTYCGQDVAVKILRDIQDDPQQYNEFAQARRSALEHRL
jgi:hypothetical protein